jgi:hypothetical protein
LTTASATTGATPRPATRAAWLRRIVTARIDARPIALVRLVVGAAARGFSAA